MRGVGIDNGAAKNKAHITLVGVVAFLRKLAGADSEGSVDYCGAEGSPNEVIRQGIPPKS